MNRRSLLKYLGLAPLAGVTDASAATNAVCMIFGHKWDFTHNSAIEEGEGKGWFLEWFVCRRCGAVSREFCSFFSRAQQQQRLYPG
jgi:hypothetical protein